MRLITWNVNSIRTRLARLLGLLERHAPDVLCLQELKVADEDFPSLDLKQAGYDAAVYGQRTYNGVAIVSRRPLKNVERSMGPEDTDVQARVIGADVAGVRVLSVYVPNGGGVGSEKWEYKLEWLARFRRFLEVHADPKQPLAVCGDFNVAPDDEDVHYPERWHDTVLAHPYARAAFQRLLDWGLVDAFRQVHPEGGVYSWWDYRLLGFKKDDGLRIDGVLVTPPLAERIADAWIDRDERKGKQPSDHAPLVVDVRD